MSARCPFTRFLDLTGSAICGGRIHRWCRWRGTYLPRPL